MNQGSLSKLGTWLKNKQTQTNKARLCRQGVTAETRAQATSMVCDHWKDVWAEQRHVNVDEAVRTLVQGFGPVQDTRWAGLTALDLCKAMCSAKGSAGPDGWAADEIRHLPFQVCELLFQLTRRWEREGLLPLQLKQARQVTLTKPGKIQADGTLQVKHTRPISVCSIFWRIYASAWASNQQLQQWASQHFHPSVVYGKGSESAEACAARLQDAFTKQGGYMATLDWTSAFDRMQPEITARALVELGLPAAIPKLLLEAWGSQQRFISFEGHTHEHVLMAGKATPQGCPLAPFILSLWVSAGTRAVEQDVQDSSAELSCYMDDRTFYSRRWEKVTDRISAWQGWSRTMGMQEAPDKVQICARGKDYVTILGLHGRPAWVQPDIKVLGACTMSGPRKYTDTEEKRLAAAFTRSALLAGASLSWERLLLAHRAFVLSVAAYGWVGRFPTQTASEKLFNSLTVGFRSGKVASRDLRQLFYGATAHLGMAVLARTWNRLCKALSNGREREWHNRPFSTLGILRRHLKDQKWVESGPWLWEVPNPWRREVPAAERSLDLRPGSRQTKEQQAHALRMQFRREAFGRYIDSKRHEAIEIRQSWSWPQLRKAFLEVDIPRTRLALSFSPAHRAVVLGSGVSPAFLQRAGKSGEDGSCPFCQNPEGHWRHVMWLCPQNRPHDSASSNPFAKRLGWITRGVGSNYALAHMATTVDRMWASRHGRDAA